MYISSITIQGFRNFKDSNIEFNDGLNIIIGHNSAGKTNLLKALQLVIEPHYRYRRLNVNDFCRDITLEKLKNQSPSVTISVTFKNSSIKYNEQEEDLRVIANWFTDMENGYTAMLTYRFYLPAEKEEEYKAAVVDVKDIKTVWTILENDFLRYYVYKLIAGSLEHPIQPEIDKLERFDFQFLGAMRNVEDDMFYGRSTMLKDVLNFFIDYGIKTNEDKTKDKRETELKNVKKNFGDEASALMTSLLKRLSEGKDVMLDYAHETGASFNNALPDFKSTLTEQDLFAALKLIIKYGEDIEISATHNGLGYNNLIYMSLLLAKMQADADGSYMGDNAKVYPILAIEEPEAHLHPAMQYKFLKFLDKNLKIDHKVRQIFITTHSSQITAAVKLDDIICLHKGEDGITNVCYPSKVFSDSDEDKISKNYVQRFLDATKSDMLFARKVIMVEGIAEDLLMGTLARYDGKSLEDHHVAVVNVNGRYFNHFLKLFNTKESPYAIPKKVACITDRDPVKKEKTVNAKSKVCYPFELHQNDEQFEYEVNAENEEQAFAKHPHIRFFSQDNQKGKTFEYELALCNPDLELLVTESMSNKDEIKAMMGGNYAKAKNHVKQDKKWDDVKNSLDNTKWDDAEKRCHLIAARYLSSLGKGENALELCLALEENYELKDGDKNKKIFNVPPYIHEALEWLLK
jgi:predicted ATP-dependent endonuclease of OLD family